MLYKKNHGNLNQNSVIFIRETHLNKSSLKSCSCLGVLYMCHTEEQIGWQPWWRYQMETISTGGFPSQRASNAGFDIFFDISLNKRLNKQTRRWWFETPSRSLWRRCNDVRNSHIGDHTYPVDAQRNDNFHTKTHAVTSFWRPNDVMVTLLFSWLTRQQYRRQNDVAA